MRQMLTKQKKTIAVLFFLLFFAGVQGWYWQQQQRINAAIQIKLHEHKSLLLLGNSHMHFGLKPFNKQSSNLAYPSELLVFTYLKIKLLQPKTILIALNPQHLQKNNDDALKNGLLSENQYAYLYSQLTPEAQLDIQKSTPFEQWAFFKTKQWLPFLGTRMKSVATHELLGGHVGYHTPAPVTPQAIEHRLNDVFGAYQYAHSPIQLKYLQSIIDYTTQQKIRLIFIGFPLHPGFLSQIPPKVFDDFQAHLKALQKIGSFEYWDYSRLFRQEDYFYDTDHLNQQGAEAFSQIIRQRLELL